MPDRRATPSQAGIHGLEQRIKADEKLAVVSAEASSTKRRIRGTETLVRALEVFGDSESAQRWMQQPNPALANRTPLRALQSEDGRVEVLNILGRIEYGVIS